MDRLRPWIEQNKKEVAFFAAAILVIVIGLIVPGGAGNVLQALGGAGLAIGILVTVGINHRPRPERKRRWPY